MKLIKYLILVALMVLSAVMSGKAQSCSGETLKFKETFGTGSNTSLATGITTYRYTGSGSLADGDYRVTKNTQTNGDWLNAPDHTGNSNGRMMVINASYTAGEFYRDTVGSLTPGAFYTVYLFIMNVNSLGTCGSSALLPKVQFVVETYNASTGAFSTLTTFSSDYIPQTSSPTWVKIGGFFTMPAGQTSIRYRLINNSSGGCGNDLAIDDITFSQCSAVTLPVTGLRLNVQSQTEKNIINWSTAQEFNTERFVVEKSTDGKTWASIQTVAAAGNSSYTKYYRVEDLNRSAEINYYRILQVDIDGKFSYSNVVVVRNSNNNAKVSVQPNPFRESLNIKVSSEIEQTVVIKIVDINGKPVKQQTSLIHSGDQTMEMSGLSNLQAGVYFLDMKGLNGNSLVQQKLVKL
ncbi:MAG: T9SS type A sorting domain-containing protein [Chitinophagaceae bacterium]|nr:T9SS type A sorting domain-containing protein [Chitinophagaceae bacterium]